ncbi:MAG: hypothetical protein HYS53_01150 [Candidatus Aenigmarchaeota archaeon]|nr:hypothetical protein [Candidatus Aenigmarchaeota archaeon]
MPQPPYVTRTPDFFSLHYSGRIIPDAAHLDIQAYNIVSLRIRGRAEDGTAYHISLSGENNPFGNFATVSSQLREETPDFRRLVELMEKHCYGEACVFSHPLNDGRKTALIQTRRPAVLADVAVLERLLLSELPMGSLTLDLYAEGMERRPQLAGFLSRVEIRGYALENHDRRLFSTNAEREPYYTRTYINDRGESEV